MLEKKFIEKYRPILEELYKRNCLGFVYVRDLTKKYKIGQVTLSKLLSHLDLIAIQNKHYQALVLLAEGVSRAEVCEQLNLSDRKMLAILKDCENPLSNYYPDLYKRLS